MATSSRRSQWRRNCAAAGMSRFLSAPAMVWKPAWFRTPDFRSSGSRSAASTGRLATTSAHAVAASGQCDQGVPTPGPSSSGSCFQHGRLCCRARRPRRDSYAAFPWCDGAECDAWFDESKDRPIHRASAGKFRRDGLVIFRQGRAEVTGVPVRREFFEIPAKSGTDGFTVLVTGGSQGSRTLNNAAPLPGNCLPRRGVPVRIMHQAGRGNAERLLGRISQSGLSGEVVEFISDMPCRLCTGRSGRVPCRGIDRFRTRGRRDVRAFWCRFPFAADNHQQHNAEAMQKAGAARLVIDSEMDGPAVI